MRDRFRSLWIGSAALAFAALAYGLCWESPTSSAPQAGDRDPSPELDPQFEPRIPETFERERQGCGPRNLTAPSDHPAQLSCSQAKAIAFQARSYLAQPPPPVDARQLALTTLDWLDPHGLWSAAPDSPVGSAFRQHAFSLLASLLVEQDTRGCRAAQQVGSRLATWVDSLREAFDQPAPPSLEDPFAVASQPIFEEGPILLPARTLAVELNRRSAALQDVMGPFGQTMRRAIRERMFPTLSADEWGGVVLAATVRAYVLLIDAHGAWAPMDEETSLYEVELEASGRHHLWGKMTRTAAGVRIDDHAVAPLVSGDVVLAIDAVPTAGLSVEQVEQLGILDPNEDHPSRRVLLYREGKGSPEPLLVKPPPAEVSSEAFSSVRLDRVAYRQGYVAVLTVLDVPDDLGMEVTTALAEMRLESEPEGVVLDLRDNGGGSIEGAKEALGPFLPGAPLFPMRRRSGKIEFDHAPVPASTDHFGGPVVVLVDSDTASAAEMIAGAMAAYERGVVVGMRTYGKGCAQEYLDDEAGVGVLRLSTLVYALPDGKPVQKVGIRPHIEMDFGLKEEREDMISTAMAPWRGPDIRMVSMVRSVPWPLHGGQVGPCRDEQVCKALRAVGLPGKSARAK